MGALTTIRRLAPPPYRNAMIRLGNRPYKTVRELGAARAQQPFALGATSSPPPLSAQAKSLKQELCGNPWADWIETLVEIGLDVLLPTGSDKTGIEAIDQAMHEIPTLCSTGDLQPPGSDVCALLNPMVSTTVKGVTTTKPAPNNVAYLIWTAFNDLRTAPDLPGRAIGAIADAIGLMGAACGSPLFGRRTYQGVAFSVLARQLMPTAMLAPRPSSGISAGAAIGIGALVLLALRAV